MNDERGNGAAPGGFLKFIGPPAVVGERLALEKLRIVRDGLADEQQRDFTLQVVALVVVPLIFRRRNAKADKHDRGIDVGGFGLPLVGGDVIVKDLQIERCTGAGDQGECGAWKGFHADHRDLLEVSAVVARRREAIALNWAAM